MLKRKFSAVLLVTAIAAVLTGSSYAGNIVLTGHDDDLHRDGAALDQIRAMLNFTRNGSTLPVLSFDQGSQLTSSLSSLGIPFTNINPGVGPLSASIFNPVLYSSIIVASDSSCGGCDNTAASIANLKAASSDIANYFNSGGGIAALAGARNASTYYGFVPSSASGFGSPPSSGYVQTLFGASIGIPAVNGDPTHNFFFEPGTSGVSNAYSVVERLGSPITGIAETIACSGCTINDGTIVGTVSPSGGTVPEPKTLALFAIGILGFVASHRKSAKG